MYMKHFMKFDIEVPYMEKVISQINREKGQECIM